MKDKLEIKKAGASDNSASAAASGASGTVEGVAAASSTAKAGVGAAKNVKSRSLLQQTWHRLLKNKGAVIGMIFLVGLVIVSLLAGFIYDYDKDIIAIDVANALQKPSLKHLFGTDNLGRDIFARIIYGARYSLAIGVGAVSIGLVVGITLGAIAGFYGGFPESL